MNNFQLSINYHNTVELFHIVYLRERHKLNNEQTDRTIIRTMKNTQIKEEEEK